ncbi:MAG: hypothetical protein C5B49_01095 [Bdellovibrio sp.]|nr:MAG: hypothetical protein C5B49_01095 [Bdellovibrio sp.]
MYRLLKIVNAKSLLGIFILTGVAVAGAATEVQEELNHLSLLDHESADVIMVNPADQRTLRSILEHLPSHSFNKGTGSLMEFGNFHNLDIVCYGGKEPCKVGLSRRPEPQNYYSTYPTHPRIVEWRQRFFGGGVQFTLEMVDGDAATLYGAMPGEGKSITPMNRTNHCEIRQKEFIDSAGILSIGCQTQSCTQQEIPPAFCRVSIAKGQDEGSGQVMKLPSMPTDPVFSLGNFGATMPLPMEVPFPPKTFVTSLGRKYTSLLGTGYLLEARIICSTISGYWRLPKSSEAPDLLASIDQRSDQEFGTHQANAVTTSDRDQDLPVYYPLYGSHQNHINTAGEEIAAVFCVEESGTLQASGR